MDNSLKSALTLAGFIASVLGAGLLFGQSQFYQDWKARDHAREFAQQQAREHKAFACVDGIEYILGYDSSTGSSFIGPPHYKTTSGEIYGCVVETSPTPVQYIDTSGISLPE